MKTRTSWTTMLSSKTCRECLVLVECHSTAGGRHLACLCNRAGSTTHSTQALSTALTLTCRRWARRGQYHQHTAFHLTSFSLIHIVTTLPAASISPHARAVDMANAAFGLPGMVEFSDGANGLPRVFLKHPYSDSGAEIYMHGATVTQWLRPDGDDALALRPDANFSGETPIECVAAEGVGEGHGACWEQDWECSAATGAVVRGCVPGNSCCCA